MARPRILFVMGFGDERPFFQRAVRWRWRWLGYEAHFHNFRWEQLPDILSERREKLLRHAQWLANRELYVVGISAGGVPAVQLLEDNVEIRRVITISSPLCWANIPTKPLLAQAFHECNAFLERQLDRVASRIVSIHGLSDDNVPIALSQREGIRSVPLPTHGHFKTICAALLTWHCGEVRRCLRADA